MKELTVVILQYNGTHLTKDLLRSIFEKEMSNVQNFEIILIDNCSTEDNGFEFFNKSYPEVRLLKNESNLGFARGLNPHLKTINSPYTLLINNDIILNNDAISKSLNFLKRKEADGVTCYMEDGEGRVMSNFSGGLNPITRLLFNVTGITRAWISNVKRLKKTVKVGYINGGFLLMNQKTFREVGFFCEKYFMYTEDVDLMIKLDKVKARLYYHPIGNVLHYDGVSAALLWDNQEKYILQLKQVLDCYKRNYSPMMFLIFKLVKLLGELKRGSLNSKVFKIIINS